MRKTKQAKALPPTPTEQQFQALNKAYQYFNQVLFGGQLPGCILNFSRKKGTHGFMAPGRWRRVGEQDYTTHEISLTPYTLYREPILVFSTLVHEQVHLWQWDFATASRTDEALRLPLLVSYRSPSPCETALVPVVGATSCFPGKE